MTRGQASAVGDTRWSPNGYHYTKTEDGWRTTHTIVVERKLGRKLTANERIKFLDGDRTNLSPDNLEAYVTKQGSNGRRRARLEARIADLQAQLEELDADVS